ncbi:MAG: ATP synthase F1 subunit delta [Cyanobacteriota bacterium]|nr:ATP synthase F1 subunit delta [Cyanobacteriota bacterium]
MKGTLLSREIAEPYAQALMAVARDTNQTEAFGEQIRSLLTLMEESSDLREFVANPIIEADNKKAVLRRILGDDSNPYLVNFMMLLVDKRRILLLENILEQFLALLREQTQTALAEVTSAKELTEEQRQQVVERVKGFTDATSVEVKCKIDPDLIGGVVIKVGSQVVDASIRGQLRQISQRLNSPN